MAEIRSVCVYCGSSPGNKPKYVEAARELGAALAAEKLNLVYGGGGIGLMGELSQSVMTAGGDVTGIIPEFLVEREKAFAAAHGTIVVTKDMHERKQRMFELADAFVGLPGGIGTLEELVEQMTWIQLGRHRKPLVLLNLDGFWEPLVALIEHQQMEGFIRPGSFRFLVADEVGQIVPMLRKAAGEITEEELRNGDARKRIAEEM